MQNLKEIAVKVVASFDDNGGKLGVNFRIQVLKKARKFPDQQRGCRTKLTDGTALSRT